jgi:hypothetical protein
MVRGVMDVAQVDETIANTDVAACLPENGAEDINPISWAGETPSVDAGAGRSRIGTWMADL